MSPYLQPRTLFCDAIEITHWLEQDRETSYSVQLRRDRSIGRALSLTDPLQRVRAWWHQVRPGMMDETPVGRLAQRLDRARRLIALSMAIAGAVVGAAVVSAVLRYDGASPVNVLTALATLVLLQIGLIVLTLVLMMPQVPGLAALQRLLGGINPGAIVAAMYTRMRRQFDNVADNVVDTNSHDLADHRHALFDLQRARGPAAARFARWQLIAWSQFAAVAFNLAVLATAGGLIALTDLAFGWSTTLQLNGTDLLRITDTLSAPWRSLWPDAVPDARLIEDSRFFRLVSSAPTSVPAAALTGWWPFLMASILTYALLPRLLLLAVSWVRVRRAAIHLLLDDPRVRALLDRMQAEEITLGADDTEPPLATTSPSIGNVAPADDHCSTVVVWGGVLSPDSVRGWAEAHLRWRVGQFVEAGGGRALALDEALIERLAVERPHLVVILVRAWEAPLLDLQDFLLRLRSRLGPACALIIVPVGPQGSPASEVQGRIWSRWTQRIADPALYLETGT